MASWLHLARAKHPDRVALESGDRSLTYSGLSELAVAAARDHREPQPVALAQTDPIEFAIALHACVLAGAPAIPIDPRLSEQERSERIESAGLPTGRGVLTVMHTSGTTSAPKRVELTHGNWLANALGSAVALGLDTEERWLCPMPLAHVGGLSILFRSTIYATTVVLQERFNAEAALNELMSPERRITLVSLVPTMLSRLLDAGLERPPTLRWALLGGGPTPAPLLERAAAAGVPVAPTYGMTEACSQIATFGLPLHGVDLRLQGPEKEILVRGPIVAPGALSETGWLYTGDLGSFDERSRLVITGRKADTIVSGGENVAPAEVESVLLEHPSVADVGVFARPDPEWGEAVIAAVVARDGEQVDAAALKAHCAERLAPFKIPKAFEQRAELPRTTSGKLLRRKLS